MERLLLFYHKPRDFQNASARFGTVSTSFPIFSSRLVQNVGIFRASGPFQRRPAAKRKRTPHNRIVL
ncbi:MAG TPA: hypothetical protein DD433_09470 [Ruminococcaceae bacterium]|nr:hypothetical protein [Oscillospiraceae bacterium]